MNSFKIIIALLILLICWDSVLYAQGREKTTGILTGSVRDQATGQGLPGVNIILENTVLGVASNLEGNFILKGIPAGTYAIRASMIGYESRVQSNVIITPHQPVELTFELKEIAIQTEAVVVTASKRQQAITDSPASITVMSARDFQQKGEIYLDRLLEYAPGVNFMGSQVNIRGSSGFSYGAGSRVMFLVDGVPMMPGDSGDIKWDVVPATQIERVEIVKGAGSALYGSSALGGVINVITKTSALKPATHIRLSAGIYAKPRYQEWRWTDRTLHYDDIDIDHSRRIGTANLFLSIGRHQGTSYRQAAHYQRMNFGAKVNTQMNSTQNLSLASTGEFGDWGSAVQWRNQHYALEVPLKSRGDKVGSYKFGVNGFHRWAVNRSLGLKTRLSYFRNRWENFYFDNNDYSLAQKFGMELQADYLLDGNHSLTFGTEETWDRVNSNLFGSHDSYNMSAYLQDEFKLLPNTAFTLGFRFDYYTIDTGITDYQFSPKFGFVWHITHLSIFRSSFGRGFRAPATAERFSEGTVSGFRIIQNPGLTAETAWSSEIGFNQTISNKITLDIAGFYNDFWDLIEPEPNAKQEITFINVTRACIKGVEVNVKGSFWNRHVNSSLSYTYMEPRDLDTDQILAYRSRHVAMAAISYKYRILELGADYRFIDRLENVKVYPLDDRVSQKVLDLQLNIDWNEWRLSFDLDNVFNYNYTQVERTLRPIRRYTMTLMWTI